MWVTSISYKSDKDENNFLLQVCRLLETEEEGGKWRGLVSWFFVIMMVVMTMIVIFDDDYGNYYCNNDAMMMR